MILIERNVMRMSQVGNEDKVVTKLYSTYKKFPQLLSTSTVGVQPLRQPTGIAFALRYIYQNNQPNYNPWQNSVNYDIASMYPNVIDKKQFKIKLSPLKYKREYVWRR